MASARPLTVHRNADHWFDLGDETTLRLAELTVVLMRKDPPFDMEYIYATYLLERAEREGTLVVNRCQSLRDCNEKLFATEFPECCPPLLVSRDMDRLRAFHSQHDDVIFKPLDGMGGSAIFRAQPGDPNVSVILETLTQSGHQTIMAQQYLAAIQEGDKTDSDDQRRSGTVVSGTSPLLQARAGAISPPVVPAESSRSRSEINGLPTRLGPPLKHAGSTLSASM